MFQTTNDSLIDWKFRIVVAVGIILLTAAAWEYIDRKTFVSKAVRTEGMIVGTVCRRLGDDGRRLAIFSFRDARGVEHQVTSVVASSARRTCGGNRVAVLYDPDDPENAFIDSFMELWGISFILGLVGVGFIVGGVFLTPRS